MDSNQTWLLKDNQVAPQKWSLSISLFITQLGFHAIKQSFPVESIRNGVFKIYL